MTLQKIGIDAGGTLTKIAYEERGHLHVRSYPNDQLEKLIQWLQLTASAAKIFVTGGKSAQIKQRTKMNSTEVEEFDALVKGTRFLLETEKQITNSHFILASIGTGTSIFHVTPDSYERLFGTGIGGGTWMGLGKLLSGKDNFHELTELAATGNHKKSDLLVRDIYAPNEPPIAGDLTAANFGKAHMNSEADTSDHLAALLQLIGETVLQFAGQAAITKQVKTIVFIGSTLEGNSKLKQVLSSFQDSIPYEPVFLERGAYAGAIGAML